MYRITFYTKKFITQQHFEVAEDKATHYHVLKNNRKISEHSNLKNAIESIIENTGNNMELENIINHISFLQNHDTPYICIGITYGDKYGVKLEMKINENYIE
jgi:hypothetical protein